MMMLELAPMTKSQGHKVTFPLLGFDGTGLPIWLGHLVFIYQAACTRSKYRPETNHLF